MKRQDERKTIEEGPIWKLPEVRDNNLTKIGPGFALGIGCGVGFGLGIFGGTGVGPGIPGLQLGFGAGVGCGVGMGFGYGFGQGIAYDQNGKHSNMSQDGLSSMVDDLVHSTRKMIMATTNKVDKLKR